MPITSLDQLFTALIQTTSSDEVRSILAGPSIQARCLECASAEPARPLNRRDMSLLDLLKAWLS